MNVSVIIVNYNTKELLQNCIDSIESQTKDIRYEIIVSDNASTDGSIEVLELLSKKMDNLQVVYNASNLGFGAANNRALPLAKGKYIFYLNSDTVLENNAIKILFDYWEQSDEAEQIGALGCFLENLDHKPIHSWGRFLTTLGVFKALIHMTYVAWRKQIPKSGGIIEKTNEVFEVPGYITGADLFLRNDSLAYFDERYFMYAEEADLEYNNFEKNGLKRLIIPEARIIHLEGASGRNDAKQVGVYDFSKKSTAMLWISSLKYLGKNTNKRNIWYRLSKFWLSLIWKFSDNKTVTKEYLAWLKELE